MSHVLDAPPFVNTYNALPAKQKRRLEEEALGYVRALDDAIAKVLSPSVGKSEDQFLVTDEIVPLYGVGPTPEEAMADYRSVVVEYYESLEEDSENLGPVLREQLEALRRLFSLLEEAA